MRDPRLAPEHDLRTVILLALGALQRGTMLDPEELLCTILHLDPAQLFEWIDQQAEADQQEAVRRWWTNMHPTGAMRRAVNDGLEPVLRECDRHDTWCPVHGAPFPQAEQVCDRIRANRRCRAWSTLRPTRHGNPVEVQCELEAHHGNPGDKLTHRGHLNGKPIDFLADHEDERTPATVAPDRSVAASRARAREGWVRPVGLSGPAHLLRPGVPVALCGYDGLGRTWLLAESEERSPHCLTCQRAAEPWRAQWRQAEAGTVQHLVHAGRALCGADDAGPWRAVAGVNPCAACHELEEVLGRDG